MRVSSRLDLDKAGHFVRSDLGPNCLQRLSVEDLSRQRVNIKHSINNFLTVKMAYIIHIYIINELPH